jgi:pyridoxal 5'-phosphate synthase pdxT subunit
MGLIGTATVASRLASVGDTGTTSTTTAQPQLSMWDALIDFASVQKKPVWGTCAGMILLAERCIGTSAVIENGQALIGGMDMTVCRNYFGAQISSFEMATPAPPAVGNVGDNDPDRPPPFPGIFIRAPAILAVAAGIDVLGTVTAVPCRQAAATLAELDRKIAAGENVLISQQQPQRNDAVVMVDDNSHVVADTTTKTNESTAIALPGAAPGSLARRVICAARRDNLLCTAFHPELTDDYRWHTYFVNVMVQQQQQSKSTPS